MFSQIRIAGVHELNIALSNAVVGLSLRFFVIIIIVVNLGRATVGHYVCTFAFTFDWIMISLDVQNPTLK